MKMTKVFGSAAVATCVCLAAQNCLAADRDSTSTGGTDRTTVTSSKQMSAASGRTRQDIQIQYVEGGIAAVCNFPAIGPDVIVGDLTGPANYNSADGYEALSVGTTSCNIGNTWLSWSSGTNQHPVISQNLYRLKTVSGSTRFEQVGYSWLKHGFYALSETLCCDNCSATDGAHLGVGCSDPYNPQRNGEQANLGPKWQVNAHTGYFDYPPASPAYSTSVDRRLKVAIADLENSSATVKYFIEGQYITPDDALYGNNNNNATHRQVSVVGSGSVWNFGLAGATQRMRQGIRAWKDNDPTVTEVEIQSDGLFILAYKVTSLGGGQWHYEYALYNMNSDKNAGSFKVPVPDCVQVSNVSFHDVDYHSGDGPGSVNYIGTDWPMTRANSVVSWETQPASQNVNANAIRWGTLYNFRFDANAPPVAVNGSLGLHKVVTPTYITVPVLGPQGVSPICPADIAPQGGNGMVDTDDLLLVINGWGNAGGAADIFPACGNGQVNVDDLLVVINAWGPCH